LPKNLKNRVQAPENKRARPTEGSKWEGMELNKKQSGVGKRKKDRLKRKRKGFRGVSVSGPFPGGIYPKTICEKGGK